MDWTEPALKPIGVLTSTACERRVYKVLAKKNSLALTLLIPSVEHVSPAASVRAIGVRVELIAPHRRPARSLRRNLGTAARLRRSGSTSSSSSSSHASSVPVAASPEHAPDGAVRDGRTRAERHPLRDHAAERAHHGPLLRGLAHGRRGALLLRRGEARGPHRLRRPQRGRLVRLHVPPVRLPRGLILNLLPRVLERGGRRGLADGPPRSAEPSPSAGGHLSRVHEGGTRERLEGRGRVGWAEEPAADEEERTTGRHVLKTCGTRSVCRAPRSV